jgi:hypothetical protein
MMLACPAAPLPGSPSAVQESHPVRELLRISRVFRQSQTVRSGGISILSWHDLKIRPCGRFESVKNLAVGISA